MHALVTGAAGFVGRHLVRHLLASGDRVLGASRTLDQSRLGQSDLDIPLVEWNVDLPASESTLAEIEAFAPTHLFHLAAIAEPRRCGASEPTPEALQTNVAGALHAFDLARLLPSRPRVILASSSHVYAPVQPEQPTVDETRPANPQTAYGRTKLAAERLAAKSGVEFVIARSFAQTGPGQEPRYLVPELVAQLVQPQLASIRIQTRQAWLDLGDVRDAVRAYRLLAERGHAGETYNIGSGVNRRSGEILAELLELAGRRDLPIEELAADAGRVRQSAVANLDKVTAHVGWRPERDFRQTLADTLAWQREHS